MPSRASTTATTTQQPGRAGHVEAAAPRSRTPWPPGPVRRPGRRTPRRSRPRKSALPMGVASSRSRVPESARATSRRWSRGTSRRRGRRPSSGAPIASKGGGAAVDPRQQADQHAGHDQHQRDRAVVGAQLQQDPAGGGEQRAGASCGHRRCVDEGQERLLGVGGTGAAEQSRRASRRREPPLAQQQQPVAAGRPRPSRGSRPAAWRPRRASRWNSSHRSRRSTGSSPTVGSSSTSSSGVADQGRGQARPATAARRRAGRPRSRARSVRSTASSARSAAARGRRRAPGRSSARLSPTVGRRTRSAAWVT